MVINHRLLFAACTSGAALLAAGSACGQSVAYTSPNRITAAGATSVSLNGSTFVNQGLVGTMRLPATLHDFNGETLGSFSGLAMDLSTWRRDLTGAYSGSLYTLPDRGPNNVGGLTTTNYAARLNRLSMTFNPYTGTTAVASSTQQGQLTQSGGFLLRDAAGQLFTGRDPQSGTVTRGGIIYPTPPAGDIGAGKIAMDAEAVAFLNDGSFYVGDEYGAMIYYFNAQGVQVGAIQATSAMLPRVGGSVNFNGTNDSPLIAGSTGRRSNQGMEGVSVSPDGKRLFAVLQSATLQDNPTNVAARRNNTRVVVYDISGTKTPTAPMAEYVLQLPTFNNSATGTGAAGTTAAQSEILALNNTQFLVLSRDGNGRGTNGNANAIAFKSVLLVDTAGATNIAGTPFSDGTTPISTSAGGNGSGALVAGITPVQQVELVNMLNTTQLGRFGVNLVTTPSTQYTLSEKWEAMGLVPTLDEASPHDFFLLIGNDNDFVSSDIDAAGITNANTALTSATAGVGDNENVIMVYRLTLPTYIDPQALAFMEQAAPFAIAGARITGAELGSAPAVAGMQALDSARHLGQSGQMISGHRVWAQVARSRVANPGSVGEVDNSSLTAGVDTGSETVRFGGVVTAHDYDGDKSSPFDLAGKGYGLGGYIGVFDRTGLYAQASVSAASLEMEIGRPASYGMTAVGDTDGRVYSASGEVGYSANFGGVQAGPFVNLRYANVKFDGYTESGAAVGNAIIPESRYTRVETSVGVEASVKTGSVTPSIKLAYTVVEEGGDTASNLVLAAVAGSATTAVLPVGDDGFISATAAVEGEAGGFGWRAAVDLRSSESTTAGQIVVGLAKRF